MEHALLITVGALFLVYLWLRFLNRSSSTMSSSGTFSNHSNAANARHQAIEPSTDRIWTLAELREYDGRDPNKPIVLAADGLVFAMVGGEGFYGPGGPYQAFAGRDASRSLATMDIAYRGADIRGLGAAEQQTLHEWVEKYKEKYTIVGKLIDHSEPNSGEPPKGGWPNTEEQTGGEEKKTNTS